MRIIVLEDDVRAEWVLNKRLGDAIKGVLYGFCLPSSEIPVKQLATQALESDYAARLRLSAESWERIARRAEERNQQLANELTLLRQEQRSSQINESAKEVVSSWQEKRKPIPVDYTNEQALLQRNQELEQHFEKAQASWLSHTENLNKAIDKLRDENRALLESNKMVRESNEILRKKRDYAEQQNEKSSQEVIRLWQEKRSGAWAQNVVPSCAEELDFLRTENEEMRAKLLHPMFTMTYSDDGRLQSIQVGQ